MKVYVLFEKDYNYDGDDNFDSITLNFAGVYSSKENLEAARKSRKIFEHDIIEQEIDSSEFRITNN